MDMAALPAFSELVQRARRGHSSAVEALFPQVYAELRRLAYRYMGRERGGHTLQATGLVHEAYLRLAGQDGLEIEDRGHFLAIAANTMRRILVEHARARGRLKRGGDRARVTLEDESGLVGPKAPVDLERLDAVLERLAALDPRQARIVELRFFGGLTVEETAAALGISPATVKREWVTARAFLRRELAQA
jgi:RNA polymerase sigma factor (TIGR02999 family)